ncbi:hypothetical protein Q5P01_003572 [Channa striata]|uniref:Plakophilin 2 n=1 Tax=Channa striata TaxID=64152 RepID=A0AA88NHY1_CHASR|nr:hypothetical protein Q5P01_003572 [Channa striata]
MEEVFKSALPQSVLDDTSLVLPEEPNAGSSTKPEFRVHQQVRLMLARNSRKFVSDGGIQLEKIKAKSCEATDEPSSYIKVNGIGFTNRSLSSYPAQRPSQRVEVSPSASPHLPHSSTPRYRGYFTCARPEPSQSHRVVNLPDHSPGNDKWRYALSEVPRGTRQHASVSRHYSSQQRSMRQTAGRQPVFANAALKQSGPHWNGNQSAVLQDKRAIEPNRGASCSAQLRMSRKVSHRRSLYPPSVGSMEVDRGRQLTRSPEMTIETAVTLLSRDDDQTLMSAASWIQNKCLHNIEARRTVFFQGGIGMLLKLLSSDNEEVQCYAAGALRNVVFQIDDNKIEVEEKDGFNIILEALRKSRDVETRRQLSGLLWNLSCHEQLKEPLTRVGLNTLTCTVLVPSSGISEGNNPKDELLADGDVFLHTTGCLRNLSSGGPDSRTLMRDCEKLIDCLVYYIRGTIADHKRNDKSTENCICILHNLSYQFEPELPKKDAQDLRESRQNVDVEPKTVGCFTHRGAKITEGDTQTSKERKNHTAPASHLDPQSPLLEESANPRGTEWLWSTITIRMYLSLIACSLCHVTQGAAIGALQNITAGHGEASKAIAFTIVKKESGLQHLKKILQGEQKDVKTPAIFLIKNLSRYVELHADIVKQVLPEVVQMLPTEDRNTDLPPAVTTSLCRILISLSQSDSSHARAIFSQGVIKRIIRISFNIFGETPESKAACILLYAMWSHRDLHQDFKKDGLKKKDFINARTKKAVHTSQN